MNGCVRGCITLLDAFVDALNRSVSSLAALALVGAAIAGWLWFDKLSDDAMLGIAGAGIGYLFGSMRRQAAPVEPPAPPPAPPPVQQP